MGVKIPSLRKKLNLLVTYGPYNSIDEIAEKLGKRPKTILSWADGTPSVTPDNVPNRSFDDVVELFASAFGGKYNQERIRDLLFAPPSWFEQEIRSHSGVSFRKLLKDEAEKSAFVLKRHPAEMTMIRTVKTPPPEADYHVGLGEYFRLVLKRDLRRYNIFALQNTNSQWGPVPFTLNSSTGHIDLPGFQDDHKYAFMQELNDEGLSVFAVVACHQALPEILQTHAAEGLVLDTSSLSALVDVLTNAPRSERRLFSVTVHFD